MQRCLLLAALLHHIRVASIVVVPRSHSPHDSDHHHHDDHHDAGAVARSHSNHDDHDDDDHYDHDDHHNASSVARMHGHRHDHDHDHDKSNLRFAIMLCGMTADMDFNKAAEASLIDRTPQREPLRFTTIWSSLMDHVVAPMEAEVHVDVFMCVDKKLPVSEALPEKLKEVFVMSTRNQYERARACWKRIGDGYDFYFKTRPDFVYFGSRMTWRLLRTDRLYSRFRYVGGLQHVNSEHMADNTCNTQCRSDPGYANDDQMWVAHRSLMDRVTAFKNGDELKKPAEQWQMQNTKRFGFSGLFFIEEVFTESLRGQGVLSAPLAVTGYPSASQFAMPAHNQCHNTSSPTYRVFQKNCGESAMSLEDLHEKMFCSEEVLQADKQALEKRGCGSLVPRLINNIKKTALTLCYHDRRKKCCKLGWKAEAIQAVTEGDGAGCRR